MNIHPQTAIGGLLPDVKIDKIVLNASSAEIKQRYPHIDHPSEAATTSNNTSDNLHVGLGMFIRDEGAVDTLGSWFTNLEIEKYMQITCIQVFNPENGLSGFKNAIQAQNTLNNLDRVGRYKAILQMIAQAKFLGVHSEDANSTAQVTVLSVPCYQPNYMDGDEIKIPYGVVTSNGKRYFDISFQKDFIVSTNKPSNLYYMAFTTLDHEKLASDFGLEASLTDSSSKHAALHGQFSSLSEELGALMGDISFGTVYTNGNMKKTAKFFLTPAGDIYTGPRHYHPQQGYMAGQTHKEQNDSEHFPLTVVKTENSKIQDFRQVKRFDSYLPSLFYDFKTQVELPNQINITSQKVLDIDNNAYASDPTVTFDSFANPRITFSINMLQLARDKFLYGGLLRDEPGLGPLSKNVSKQIFKDTSIIEMKVIRQKINTDADDTRDPEEVIGVLYEDGSNSHQALSFEGLAIQLRSSMIQYGRLPKKTNVHHGKILLGQAAVKDLSEQVKLNETSKKIKTFNITDFTAKAYKGATFSYKIKMTVRDGSSIFLKRVLKNALKARPAIVSYLADAQRPEVYDGVKRKFRQSYIENNYSKINSSVQMAMNQLFMLLGIIKSSDQAFNRNNIMSMLTDLRPFVIPTSGSPSGISTFLSIFDKIYTTIASFAGLKNIKLEGTAAADKMFNSNGTMKEVIEIVIPFKSGQNTQADKTKAGLVKVPFPDDLCFDFFSNAGIGNVFDMQGTGPLGHTNYNEQLASSLLTLTANSIEDLRLYEIGKYFEGDPSQQQTITTAGGSGTAASVITFKPNEDQTTKIDFTPQLLRSFWQGDAYGGVDIYSANSYLGAKQKLRIKIGVLRLIAQNIGISTRGLKGLKFKGDIADLLTAEKYLLSRIASRIGIFSSGAVLQDIAGSLQNFSEMSVDESQELGEDALTQLGMNEHIANSLDGADGGDIDSQVSKNLLDLYTYLIFKHFFFNTEKATITLRSFNLSTENNQFEQMIDNFSHHSAPAVSAQSMFKHYLPLQVKYMFIRDSTVSSELDGAGIATTTAKDIYAESPGDQFNGEVLDYNNMSDFILKNSNIYRLFYMSGYETHPGTNQINIKSPIFSPYVSSATPNAHAAKSLICFFKRFEDNKYTINLKEKLNFNIMNQYFIVDMPANEPVTNTSPTNEEPETATVYVPPTDLGIIAAPVDADVDLGDSIIINPIGDTLGGYK